jgi:hypothetical protein
LSLPEKGLTLKRKEAQMPHKGYKQSPEHIAARQESIQDRALADAATEIFSFLLGFPSEDRHKIQEIVEGSLSEAERIAAENLAARRRREHTGRQRFPAPEDLDIDQIRETTADMRRILRERRLREDQETEALFEETRQAQARRRSADR